MAYLNLLRDLGQQHRVHLMSGEDGWYALAFFPKVPSEDGTGDMFKGQGETPEQAIRRLYLNVYPIKGWNNEALD